MLKDSLEKSGELGFAEVRKMVRNHKPSLTRRGMHNYIKFLKKFGEIEQLDEIDPELYKSESLNYII